MRNIPLIKPFIPESAKQAVCDVLDSGYLTEGPVTRAFEAACAEYMGVKHAIAVCNCTVGLEVALRALDIGPGDEVIVPDYTYPATADVVRIVGATTVLVDVCPESMLSCKKHFEAAITNKTKAIMPVSIFGNPLQYDGLLELQQEHGFRIIEDAACSIGAKFGDTMVGAWGDIAVFSMHPRKFITTGEGGLITTNNDDLAAWMRSYKAFGYTTNTDRSTAGFGMIGTNYKLCNIQAAVGLSQMEIVDELLAKRIELSERYYQILGARDDVGIPAIAAQGRHSFQSCCIYVEGRDRIMSEMRERGIEVQIGTYSLHKQAAFAEDALCRWVSDFSGSQQAFNRCLTLPVYHEMSEDDQDYVITNLVDVLGAG